MRIASFLMSSIASSFPSPQLASRFFTGKRALALKKTYVETLMKGWRDSDVGMVAHVLLRVREDPRVADWSVLHSTRDACASVFGHMLYVVAPKLPVRGEVFDGVGHDEAGYVSDNSDAMEASAADSQAAVGDSSAFVLDHDVVANFFHFGAIGTGHAYRAQEGYRRSRDSGVIVEWRCVRSASPFVSTSKHKSLPTDAGGARVSLGTHCPAVVKLEVWDAVPELRLVLVRRFGMHNHACTPHLNGRHPDVELMLREELFSKVARRADTVRQRADVYIEAHHNAMLADARRFRDGESITWNRPTRDGKGFLPRDDASPTRVARGKYGSVADEESRALRRAPPPLPSSVLALTTAPAAPASLVRDVPPRSVAMEWPLHVQGGGAQEAVGGEHGGRGVGVHATTANI